MAQKSQTNRQTDMRTDHWWACPSQKEGDGLQAYQAFVLLYCIIAINIVVPVTTELSLLQRRGGARKPINALSQSDWCEWCWNVLRSNLIGAARFSAAERMLDRLCNPSPYFWDGHAHLDRPTVRTTITQRGPTGAVQLNQLATDCSQQKRTTWAGRGRMIILANCLCCTGPVVPPLTITQRR